MRKASPEVWENYMGAVSAYMNRIDSLEATMRVDMERLVADGKLALAARKKVAKQVLPKLEERIAQIKKFEVPGDDEGRRILLALEDRAEQLRRWKSKDYGVEDILIDAGAHVEQGSGVMAAYPELLPYVTRAKELAAKYADLTKQERGLVANALSNMARFAEGDPTRHVMWQEEMARVLGMLDETVAKKHAMIEQSRRAAAMELTRIGAAKKLFGSVHRDKIVQVLEGMQAGELSKPVAQIEMGAVRNYLREVFHDDPAAVDQILQQAALVMRDDDRSRALLELAHVLRPDVEKFALVREMAPGTRGTAQSVRWAITRYLDRLDEQEKVLREVFVKGYRGDAVVIGGKTVSEGMPAGAVKSMLLEQSHGLLARAKVVVGEREWVAFHNWWVQGATARADLPASWAEGAKAMDRSALLRRVRLGAEEAGVDAEAGRALALRLPAGIEAEQLAERAAKIKGAKKAFTEEGLFAERLRQTVANAPSDEAAVAKLRDAVYLLMAGGEGTKAMPPLRMMQKQVDEIARRLLTCPAAGSPPGGQPCPEGRSGSGPDGARRSSSSCAAQGALRAGELGRDVRPPGGRAHRRREPGRQQDPGGDPADPQDGEDGWPGDAAAAEGPVRGPAVGPVGALGDRPVEGLQDGDRGLGPA